MLPELSSDEIIDILRIFKDNQDICFAEIAETSRPVITGLVNELLLMKPYFLLREDTLSALHFKIFRSELYSDFILDLGFRFFFQLGGKSKVMQLAETIANALNYQGDSSDVNLIPRSIAESFASASLKGLFSSKAVGLISMMNKQNSLGQTVATFLESNRHLIVFYLLYMVNLSNPPMASDATVL
jgi:hypothetical protein